MLEDLAEAIGELPTGKITDIITDKLKKAELEFLKNIIGFIEHNEAIDNHRAQLLMNIPLANV